MGWETTNWSEGFASWCDKESRKRTYVSDVHVLKLLDRFGDGCIHLAIHSANHRGALGAGDVGTQGLLQLRNRHSNGRRQLNTLRQLHRDLQRLGADGGINPRHPGVHREGAIQRQLNADRPFQHGFIVCGDETVPKTPLEITKARGQRSTVSTRSSS